MFWNCFLDSDPRNTSRSTSLAPIWNLRLWIQEELSVKAMSPPMTANPFLAVILKLSPLSSGASWFALWRCCSGNAHSSTLTPSPSITTISNLTAVGERERERTWSERVFFPGGVSSKLVRAGEADLTWVWFHEQKRFALQLRIEWDWFRASEDIQIQTHWSVVMNGWWWDEGGRRNLGLVCTFGKRLITIFQ